MRFVNFAEQTSTSSEHIYRIIISVQEDTRQTVAKVESGRLEAEATTEAVQVAREVFDTIMLATSDISMHSQEVTAAI